MDIINKKIFGLHLHHTSDVDLLRREVMLTVSSNKKYCGVFVSTNPAATGHKYMPDKEKDEIQTSKRNKNVSFIQSLLFQVLNSTG